VDTVSCVIYVGRVIFAVHQRLLVFSKLPETMAGVSEQVNKEVNKSLVERGFPTTKPEQQQLLKGQICAVAEPNNAIYKLMSECLLNLLNKITDIRKLRG